MHCTIFEDHAVRQLYPPTLARPAYAISCGSWNLADLLTSHFDDCLGVVRPHLTAMQEHSFPRMLDRAHEEGSRLLVNAAIVPSVGNLQRILAAAAENRPFRLMREGRLIAALVPPRTVVPNTFAEFNQFLSSGLDAIPAVEDVDWRIFMHAHDIIRYNPLVIAENLEMRLRLGPYQEVREGVFAGGEINLADHIVFDTRKGPILIEEGTSIGPFCYLRGPAYIGRGARIIEHSAIKDAVSLGHTTKIGGEVEETVIEPYSNKQHHGFLGHSYLGSWINLGAGTSNSDLKNTYGTVKMDYPSGRVATDMQFIGAILGDYSKTAINTGIFTGKTVGVCSMLYGFVTTNVPSFVNYARHFGQVTELPPEVMISTQQRMFERRNVSQTPSDIQLIHDMYLLTQEERQLTGEPLVL